MATGSPGRIPAAPTQQPTAQPETVTAMPAATVMATGSPGRIPAAPAQQPTAQPETVTATPAATVIATGSPGRIPAAPTQQPTAQPETVTATPAATVMRAVTAMPAVETPPAALRLQQVVYQYRPKPLPPTTSPGDSGHDQSRTTGWQSKKLRASSFASVRINSLPRLRRA